ncbi:MAG: hypothetical protein H6838_19870 [Planctomycetes bacterium]|nr:hypothetical protein [Planctomycetota bacterium]
MREEAMSDARRNVLLGCVLVIGALVELWILAGQPGDELVGPAASHELMSPAQGDGAAVQAEIGGVVRVHPEWVPDGRLWLKVVDEGGNPVPDTMFAWAAEGAREAPAMDVVAEDGWSVIPYGEEQRAQQLLVVGSGFLTTRVENVDPDARSTVRLVAADGVVVELRDCETQAVVRGVELVVSHSDLEQGVEPASGRRWVPGVDPMTAIYRAVSEGSGRALLSASRTSATWRVLALHEHWLLARTQPQVCEWPSGDGVVFLQMPAVAAVRYVGADLLQASMTAGAAPPVPPERKHEIARLKQIVAQITGGDARVRAVAFLPDVGRLKWGKTKVYAKALARVGGERVDEVLLEPLNQFDGPVDIVCGGGPVIVTSKVTIEPPPAGVYPVDGRFRVVLGGEKWFQPRTIRLGDTVELPRGWYRVRPMLEGGGALSPEPFQVHGGGEEVVSTKWKDGVFFHRLVVNGDLSARHTQLVIRENGKVWVLDTMRDEQGVAFFWRTRKAEDVRVLVTGWEGVPARFVQNVANGWLEAACSLERRYEAGRNQGR